MSVEKAASRGRVVVVSGPSGAGKTTVLNALRGCAPVPLVESVSATTRPPRPGEVDGVDYHFLTDEDFQSLRARGKFLECFQVFAKGHWYGTLLSEVATGLAAGKWVILGIDVQGAMAVLDRFADAVTIFVRPGSWEELERRLRGRGTESKEELRQRLDRARKELSMAGRYRHQVVNDNVEQAVRQFCDILRNESQAESQRNAG
jgi:guanylate kinase